MSNVSTNPPSSPAFELMKMEWENLRTEQEFLKGCQLRYFALSITVVGVFVGLVHFGQGDLDSIFTKYPWIFLSPLLVTVPCWWIYFDKSKTIGRIVGYLRVLEDLMLSKDPVKKNRFMGWERSLGIFRERFTRRTLVRNDNVYGIPLTKQILSILLLRSAHKYWTIHFYSFSLISFICLALAWNTQIQRPLLYMVAGIIFVTTFATTFWTLKRLIFGRNSYDAHEEAWREILKITGDV